MKNRLLLLHLFLALLLFAPILPVGFYQSQAADLPLLRISSVTRTASVQSIDYHSCGEEVVSPQNLLYEQEVVVLVNQERANLGLPPLKRVDLLDQAARYHSADLGQDNYFEHDSYDRIEEELSFVCLWWTRVQTFYPAVRAENIAAGYTSPASVVQAWMDSLGHRQNILSTYSDEIGVGYFQGDGQYSAYWTQDFGDRSDVFPVVINGEAAETDDRMVSLYIYGEWTEMRLRNNDGEWTSWQPFQNTLEWQLPALSGEHQVTVEMRDEYSTTSSSDSIFLLTQPTEPELGNLSEFITFTYSIPTGKFLPSIVEQTPLNIGSAEPLSWEITTQSPWFEVSPMTGNTPDGFDIVPIEMISPTLITTTSIITISAKTTMGLDCTPQVINVSFELINTSFSTIYIPIISN